MKDRALTRSSRSRHSRSNERVSTWKLLRLGAGGTLFMNGHGQDARATSDFAAKGAVEYGLEKVVQAAAARRLLGFQSPDVAWSS